MGLPGGKNPRTCLAMLDGIAKPFGVRSLPLVVRNTREFMRVSEQNVENWQE